MDKEKCITKILASVALEEMGLASILGFEANQMRYAMGSLPNNNPVGEAPSIEELLMMNESVKQVLDNMALNQLLLRNQVASPTGCCCGGTTGGAMGPTDTGILAQ